MEQLLLLKLCLLEDPTLWRCVHCRGMVEIRAQGAVSLLLLSSSVNTILLSMYHHVSPIGMQLWQVSSILKLSN